MKALRTVVASALVMLLAVPVFAQSSAQAPSAPVPQTEQTGRPGKGLVYTGAALFGVGMGTALYGFIRVGNGEFSTFGEATARNKPLGAAGMATAFAGGALMFLGTRTKYAPSAVTVTRTEVSVARTMTW